MQLINVNGVPFEVVECGNDDDFIDGSERQQGEIYPIIDGVKFIGFPSTGEMLTKYGYSSKILKIKPPQNVCNFIMMNWNGVVFNYTSPFTAFDKIGDISAKLKEDVYSGIFVVVKEMPSVIKPKHVLINDQCVFFPFNKNVSYNTVYNLMHYIYNSKTFIGKVSFFLYDFHISTRVEPHLEGNVSVDIAYTTNKRNDNIVEKKQSYKLYSYADYCNENSVDFL